MFCISKAAISLDGYMDDVSKERRIFSGAEDAAAVDKLRSNVDAILIGAETLRQDNPRLRIRSKAYIEERKAKGLPQQPLRVVLTLSGELPLDSEIFIQNEELPLVFCPVEIFSKLEHSLQGRANIVAFDAADGIVEQVICKLEARGIKRLLVEGGAQIHSLFLESSKINVLRLAIAPVILGKNGATPLYPILGRSALAFPEARFESCGALMVAEFPLKAS